MAKATKESMEARHRATYEMYLSILESYGELGKYMPKKKIYADVAEKVFYDPNTVRIIVTEQMKKHSPGADKRVEQMMDHAKSIRNANS